MDSKEKLQLVKRNTNEVVTEEELKEILEKKEEPITYCGYEISGPAHLGSLIPLTKQMDFQKAGFKVKVLLADLHTHLNLKGEKEWIEKMAKYWEETFKAFGLKEAEFIKGTDFQLTPKYTKDLLELSTKVTINRANRSMRQVSRSGKTQEVSQLIYPLMQALDIPQLDVDIAHGGMEQRKIHMLARDHLPNIGYKAPTAIHTPLLISLQGPDTKMSSSNPKTTFPLHADPETIKERINGAYCPQNQVKGNPIIEIIKLIIMPTKKTLKVTRPDKYGGNKVYKSMRELKKDFKSGDLHPADLKKSTAKTIVEILKPIRQHFKSNPKYLEPLKKL